MPSFGMYPYYGEKNIPNEIVEVKKLWCRPCSKIGYNKCPLGHFKCMKRTSTDHLLAAVRRLM